jgi:hypothetical protein
MKRKAAPKDELGLAMESPGDSPRTPITVAALTSAIRDVLEEGFEEVWVAGEISNFRSPGSGHLYFTLKDATATLAAVMFRQEAARIGFAPRASTARSRFTRRAGNISYRSWKSSRAARERSSSVSRN